MQRAQSPQGAKAQEGAIKVRSEHAPSVFIDLMFLKRKLRSGAFSTPGECEAPQPGAALRVRKPPIGPLRRRNRAREIGAPMRVAFLRFGIFLFALSLPLAGCLEQVGRPPYNHGPTAKPTCNRYAPGGDLSYSCPKKP
jgi:hypothetical protein